MSLGPDSYEHTRARGTGPSWTRLYLPRGHYAHLMAADDIYVVCEASRAPHCMISNHCCCGFYSTLPGYDDLNLEACACRHADKHSKNEWLGTGSQEEYEKAARLPLCLKCFAIRERQIPDHRLGAGHRSDLRDEL